MALKACRECGQQVSTEAASCPKCGVPNPTLALANIAPPKQPQQKKKSNGKAAFGIVILLLFVLALSRGGDDQTNSSTAATEPNRVVSKIDPAEAERARIAEAAAKAKKDADCRADLQCWADKGTIAAGIFCREKIEKIANYSMKWTDSWYEPKFSHFRWAKNYPFEKGVVTYLGDKAQFQNGFGAYQNVIYSCDMVPGDKNNVIYDVSAKPGRLN
ncbi:hypothetical protein [Methylobacterium sp.]|jgi:hypothetical protein|uniref:hypothetical protein n=1 Tax=Methylobacterium sp. TaxID=409 RepID=UPI0025E17FBA|nr:hypothetical protein [Methylobacterium sp.]MBY0256337.1 hypothetical protein [Methylobacterium sp.]